MLWLPGGGTGRGGGEEEEFREPAFYVKSRFPAPLAKTIIFSRLTGNVRSCADTPMSYFSSLGRNRMGGFGRGSRSTGLRTANMHRETGSRRYSPMSRCLKYSVICRQPYESSCRRGCGSTRRGANMHLEAESLRYSTMPGYAWSPCAEHLLSRSGFPRISGFPKLSLKGRPWPWAAEQGRVR